MKCNYLRRVVLETNCFKKNYVVIALGLSFKPGWVTQVRPVQGNRVKIPQDIN